MKRRSRRRIPTRFAKAAKRGRKRNPPDEEDYNSASDSDIISSDQGDDSKRAEEEEKEKRELVNKEKGKAVLEIGINLDSESDSSDEDSEYNVEGSDYELTDDSTYGLCLRKTRKSVLNKGKANKQKGKEIDIEEPEVHFDELEEVGIGNLGEPEVHQEEPVVHIDELKESGNVHCGRWKKKTSKKKRGKKDEDRPLLLWEIWEDENEKWIDANETEDIDSNCQDEVLEAAEAPPDLLMPLLRYQKEWLAWALKQEESVSRGGILADEMGMGKTIQAIALVLAKRAMAQTGCGPSGLSDSPNSSKALPEIKTTLVICPVVAVIQWENEITRFTPPGNTKVLVYHGANRKKNINQFSEYDFVLTTYSIIEAEYRKNMMPMKVPCVWCGKSYHPKKMTVHLRYFCGPNAVKTAKQSKQVKKGGKRGSKSFNLNKKSAALEVSSESEGSQEEGAGEKTKKQGKQETKAGFSQADADQDSPTRKSILHSVKWNRIILDEAHFIKDRRCNTAKAVLALESSYKWALSGTPLQNRVGELYSLVRFLQISPYSYYFCRDCDCKTLDYSSTTACPNCVHKSVRHFCWWNKYVAKPIQSSGNAYEGRSAMILLKNKLLKSIVLRRTKKGRAADLALPPRIVTLRRDTLDIKEEDYYESLYNESQLQFNTYIEAGTLMNNYAHIFDLLTRLRQAVDHPYLVIYSNTAALKNGSSSNNEQEECGICHDPAEDPVVTSCAHVFCKTCLTDFSAALGQVSCPSCSKPLTADFTTKMNPGDQGTRTTVKGFRCSSILNRICLEDFQTSTKIDALREEIRFMIEKDGSAKGIVFSQFTSFLDLIHYSLQKSGINCVQLVGSMTMAARDNAIKRFTDDPDCKIFLMSLKAGGIALNLTVASHVFLMDPWWNPAVERQAQDRIHRIGQYKPIRIVRFIIENTIEERILKLQEKKELVFEGTVGGSAEALIKLTEADLRFLFAI
ncbi:SNF2-related [Macleaya cordata]|uniref:SNF2-related n=1 Tax=Macleaya cordata TaxID=56857 RepID=A0A200QH53_MACCD|nr:SNF2-related [Macleaya cordata]